MQSDKGFSSSSGPLKIFSPGNSPRFPVGGGPPLPFLTPIVTPGCVAKKRRQQSTPGLHGSGNFAKMLRILVADLDRLSRHASLMEKLCGLNEVGIFLDGSHAPRMDSVPGACSGGSAAVDHRRFLSSKSPREQSLGRPFHKTTTQVAEEMSCRPKPLSSFTPRLATTQVAEEISCRPKHSSSFTPRLAWREIAKERLVDVKVHSSDAIPRPSFAVSPSCHHPSLKRALSHRGKLELTSDKFVLHPSGKPRLFWNMLCLAFIVYDLFAIPMMLFPTDDYMLFNILDWMCVIFWSVDIVITFRTGYFAGSQVVMRPLYIAKHYMKSWMLPDLGVVGFEWFSTLYDDSMAGGSALRAARTLRVLRSVRLVRLAKMKSLWSTIAFWVHSGMLHSMFSVIKLTSLLVFTVHLITCLWFGIGDSTDGWITNYSPGSPRPEDDVFFWYSASTRWTLAQINGRTDMDKTLNMSELVYTCFIAFFFAVIFMAIFISSITALMMDMAAMVEHKTSLLRTVRSYLKRQPVSPKLVSSVHRSLAQEKSDRIEEESRVLGALPPQLACDLLFEVRSSVLLGYEWFEMMNVEFPRPVRHLCHTASELLCAHRSEIVFEKGDACTRMLFIDQGMVLYYKDISLYGSMFADAFSHSLSDNGKSANALEQRGVELRRGQWLSEAALWVEWNNQGWLRSGSHAAHTWLITVNMQEFATTVRQYEVAYAKSVIFAQQFAKMLRDVEILSDLPMTAARACTACDLHAPSSEKEKGTAKKSSTKSTKSASGLFS